MVLAILFQFQWQHGILSSKCCGSRLSTYKMKNLNYMKLKSFLILIFTCFGLSSLYSQNQHVTSDTNKYVIVRNNGVELIGKILSDDGRELLFESQSIGKIYIPKSDIKSITLYNAKNVTASGEYRETGPFTTRYQFSTNAFPIEKGEDYAMVNLYGPEVHFAVSKNFSLGIMSTWLVSPFVLAMKYSIPTNYKNINLGIGTLFGSTGYLNQGRGFAGLHWGMITFGDRLKNLTISIGYSYLNSGFDRYFVPGTYSTSVNPPRKFGVMNKAPIIGIGGLTSIGKKASFIFDAMFLIGKSPYQYYSWNGVDLITYTQITYSSSPNLILMPGMRFQKTENKAFQISLAGIIGDGYSFPLPMCSWFFKF